MHLSVMEANAAYKILHIFCTPFCCSTEMAYLFTFTNLAWICLFIFKKWGGGFISFLFF